MAPSIFVVGYGPGISHSIADLFASKGFNVGLVSRSDKSADPSVKSIRSAHPSIHVETAQADVASNAAHIAVLDSLKKALGYPTVVIYNVGTLAGAKYKPIPVLTLTPELLAEHFQLNTTGAFVAAKWLATNGDTTKDKRAVLFTNGTIIPERQLVLSGLSVAKAALRNLTSILHDALKINKIHVGAVGVIHSVRHGVVDGVNDADEVAKKFWALYDQKEGAWTKEEDYDNGVKPRGYSS